jgi:hypothetical protein
MLKQDQRAELEKLGVENVRAKLTSYGNVLGILHSFLQSGSPYRVDVEDWLAEKGRDEAARQRATLHWARIAGWAAIIGTLLTAVGVGLQILR